MPSWLLHGRRACSQGGPLGPGQRSGGSRWGWELGPRPQGDPVIVGSTPGAQVGRWKVLEFKFLRRSQTASQPREEGRTQRPQLSLLLRLNEHADSGIHPQKHRTAQAHEPASQAICELTSRPGTGTENLLLTSIIQKLLETEVFAPQQNLTWTGWRQF